MSDSNLMQSKGTLYCNRLKIAGRSLKKCCKFPSFHVKKLAVTSQQLPIQIQKIIIHKNTFG